MLGSTCFPCCSQYLPRLVPECVRIYYTVNNGNSGGFGQYSGFQTAQPYLYACWYIPDFVDQETETASSITRTTYARYFWSDGLSTAQVEIQQNSTRFLAGVTGVQVTRQATLSMFLLGARFRVSSLAMVRYQPVVSLDSPTESSATYQVFAQQNNFPTFDGEVVVCGTTYQAQAYANPWIPVFSGSSPSAICSPIVFRSAGTYSGSAYNVDINVIGTLGGSGEEVLPLPIGALRPQDLVV